MIDFKLVFKTIRKNNNLTQIDFADKLSVSRSAIAQIESSNNNPSKELVLKLLEVFDVSDELRKDLEMFARSGKTVVREDITTELAYTKGDVWGNYVKLVENKKNILCLCIFLKEVYNYDFTVEEKNELTRVEFAIGYLDNFVLGRIQFREHVFKKVIADLKASSDLIEYFSNKILPNYSKSIRNFEDLYNPKTYTDDDLNFPI